MWEDMSYVGGHELCGIVKPLNRYTLGRNEY